MFSHGRIVLVLAVIPLAAYAEPAFQIRSLDISPADDRRAMRERPLIFGVGIMWNGRSTVLEMPEDFNAALIQRVRDAGVTATRVGIDWQTIEEEPGQYRWEWLEQERGLSRLLELDIEIIALIATTPGWASPTGEAGTFAPTEESAELFEAFCEALARRYRGRIRYYQYGNNMDIDPGWMPKADPVQYARWLKRAYRGLKAGDPDCIVGTGSHIGRSAGFLKILYQQGAADYCDAVAVNPWPAYESPQGDEAFDWKRIEAYRAVMVENNDADTPIWCTEFGWPFERVGSEKQGALANRALDYLVHYPFITIGIYITMADWHRGNTGLFGLCDKDLLPRPAYEVWTRRVKPLRDLARPVSFRFQRASEKTEPRSSASKPADEHRNP